MTTKKEQEGFNNHLHSPPTSIVSWHLHKQWVVGYLSLAHLEVCPHDQDHLHLVLVLDVTLLGVALR